MRAPVPGYEGFYEVTTTGEVISLPRTRGRALLPGRILQQIPHPRFGYMRVSLSREGVVSVRSVHSLVTEAFIGPRPLGHEVRHLDGNPANNRLSNLTYGTRAQNEADKRAHGTNYPANRDACSKGHKYNPANTAVAKKDGSRVCRECARAAQRNHRERTVL